MMINNRYQLERLLGRGGMGAVYRAIDRLTGQAVALKRVLLDPDQLDFNSRDSSTQQHLALAREFATLASLRHPHIIEVLDYGFDEDRQPYFTMTLLERARTILQAGQDQPVTMIGQLLLQLLAALTYLHRRGILHRDLKPGNVLVDGHGRVRVLDFGLAVEREQARDMSGTVAYMAPEVLSGGQTTPAADLYAVGVIAYEMLVGRHPYHDDNLLALMQAIMLEAPDLSEVPSVADVDLAETVLLHDQPQNATLVAVDVSDLDPLPAPQLGDDNPLARILERLLHKDPAARYRDAAAVTADLCAALGLPLPTETADIRESFLQAARFVGREDELAALQTALTQTLDGLGSAWLIGGESGVGKTRLVDELRPRALVAGALVVRGGAVEGRPYQVWREPLRRLVLNAPLSDLEAGVLEPLVPDIGALLGRDIPPAPPLPGQQRLAQTIADLCRRQPMPVVLVLEDLHWAAEGVLPLQQIVGAVGTDALMVIGTYRDDERPDLPQALAGMQLLSLGRLDATAIAELSASMVGEVGRRPDILRLLQQETEGNVFFLVETVRALAEEAGRLAAIGERGLPQAVMAGGVQQIIRRRLARVPAWGQPLLRQAAVLGRDLDLTLLEGLRGAVVLETWLTACADAAVLAVGEGRWGFAHDKLRLAALAEVSPHELQTLHRQAAQRIEAVYPDDVTYAGVLARHWQAAGDDQRQLHYTLLAGRHLLDSSAFQEAQSLLEDALTIEDPRQVRVLCLLGDALEGQSDYQTARSYFEESLALASDERGRAEALAGLGRIASLEGDWETAATHFGQSLQHFTALDDAGGQANCHRNLGNVSYFQGDYGAARAHYEQALGIYQTIGDRRGIGGTMGNLGNIAQRQGRLHDAQRYFEQCLEHLRAIGDKRGTAGSLINLGNISDRRADPDAAHDYYQQSLAVFETIGDRRGMAIALSNLGVIDLNRGHYDLSLERLQRSRAIYEAIGNRHGVAICLISLSDVALLRGEAEAQVDYLREAQAIFEEIGDPRRVAMCIYGLGVALCETGQTQAGREHLESALTAAREIGVIKLEIDALGELARTERDPSAARRRLAQALAMAQEVGDAQTLTHLLEVATTVLRHDQRALAARLKHIVLKHPATESGTRWRLERLDLEPEGDDDLEAAVTALQEELRA